MIDIPLPSDEEIMPVLEAIQVKSEQTYTEMRDKFMRGSIRKLFDAGFAAGREETLKRLGAAGVVFPGPSEK